MQAYILVAKQESDEGYKEYIRQAKQETKVESTTDEATYAKQPDDSWDKLLRGKNVIIYSYDAKNINSQCLSFYSFSLILQENMPNVLAGQKNRWLAIQRQ